MRSPDRFTLACLIAAIVTTSGAWASDRWAQFRGPSAEGVTLKTEVMESPGCRFVIISDPDGNDITIHKHKES